MKLATSAVLAGLLMSSAALAQTSAMAGTDLNLRAGPGPTYQVIAVIPRAQAVTVDGCLADSNWCRVAFGDVNGWASGDYLTAMVDQAEAPIYVNREKLAVPVVTYEKPADGAIGGGATGAIAGAIIAGPVGAMVGAAIGMTLGDAAQPEERVVTYVRTNPIDPIYLDGEVVVGAGVPETVTLTEVPDSPYYYAYINGVPVLVQRDNRQVAYIVR